MAPVHKIAVIQLYAKPLDPPHNFSKARQFIRAAAAQGAHLAVLPEYHLTSFHPSHPDFASLCARTWRHYLREYRRLAAELGICIVPGTLIKARGEREDNEDETDEDDYKPRSRDSKQKDKNASQGEKPKLENAAYFIDHEGSVLSVYIKKNLWGPHERNHLTSSGRAPHDAFDSPLGKVGMLVCWDLAFPEAFRELIAGGVKIIIIPTFWKTTDATEKALSHSPSAEPLFIDTACTTRAFENTCAVVLSNAGGPPGKGYAGLSQITVPLVGPIVRLGSSAEGMSVVDLDMQVVEDAEENYQVRADLARDDWHYDYRHGREGGTVTQEDQEVNQAVKRRDEKDEVGQKSKL